MNGKPITEEVILEHNDRLLIGTNTIFLFKQPERAEFAAKSDAEIDFDFAMSERMDLVMQDHGHEEEL